jgi:hypothetical protein
VTRRRTDSGQATLEYVALLALLAAILAGAVALTSPALGSSVIATIRTGLCIVGGDVCRAADAAAAGLEPCLTDERWQRQDTTLDIAVVRIGAQGEWQLAVRSDGTATVTRLEGTDGGVTAGAGVTFSPLGVDAAVSGAMTLGYRGGEAWSFADARSAAAFLARARSDADAKAARPPTVRWHGLGAEAGGEAAVAVADLASAGLDVGADATLGLRTEGARRTLALAVGRSDLRLFADLPGFPAAAGATGEAVAEVTWVGGRAEELVLRTARAAGDRREEYTARLPLTDPAARAAAEAALRPGGGGMAALAAQIARAGVLEHATYRVQERRRGISVSGRLGVALGFEHERVSGERRLTGATTIVRGGPPQRRLDCVKEADG